MEFINQLLTRANIDLSDAFSLGVVSELYIKSLAIKLFVYFKRLEKVPVKQSIAEGAEKLFISESRAYDYFYHYKFIELPIVFGVNLSLKKDGRVQAEYYARHIYKKQKKTFTMPKLNQYLTQEPKPLINNRILNGVVLPNSLTRQIIAMLVY